jgi:UDP-GlcNAc3NAcA epimerase
LIKIATIVGARPQFIKAAVVSRAFSERAAEIKEFIIHTGQHFDSNMSDVFFDELAIPKPTYLLNIGGGTHGQNTGRMVEKIEEVLIKEKPNWVLVYGDTDSTLAGSLAASKLHIPIAHVEAGLRSFNRKMPEEINRVLTDHISSLLFTPTYTGTENLQREGISLEKIRQVGDVMFDAVRFYQNKAEANKNLLSQLGVVSKEYVLVTLHRAENVDNHQRLLNIVTAFQKSNRKFIWPMHPRTRQRLLNFKKSIPTNIKVIDPVGYLDMVLLEKHAALITTDSGGIQKEAYFHQVPCITLRDETEWVELLAAGVNILAGSDTDQIIDALSRKELTDSVDFKGNLYGDGYSAQKIVEQIIRFNK